jgi:hypothetical protein
MKPKLSDSWRPEVVFGKSLHHTVRIANVLPGLAGAAMASWGVSMIYGPAGWITGGVFLLAFGFENNAKKAPPRPPAAHRVD